MAALIHLVRRGDWTTGTREGLYISRSLVEDGFIHLCRPEEAVMVANLVFADVDELLAVGIDSRRLRAELRLDSERPGGFAWPHLHGPMDLEAAVCVLRYMRRPDGRYPRLPAALRGLDCGLPLRFHDGMTAVEAIAVLDLLAGANIDAVVDGGWAVVGRTRVWRHGPSRDRRRASSGEAGRDAGGIGEPANRGSAAEEAYL